MKAVCLLFVVLLAGCRSVDYSGRWTPDGEGAGGAGDLVVLEVRSDGTALFYGSSATVVSTGPDALELRTDSPYAAPARSKAGVVRFRPIDGPRLQMLDRAGDVLLVLRKAP